MHRKWSTMVYCILLWLVHSLWKFIDIFRCCLCYFYSFLFQKPLFFNPFGVRVYIFIYIRISIDIFVFRSIYGLLLLCFLCFSPILFSQFISIFMFSPFPSAFLFSFFFVFDIGAIFHLFLWGTWTRLLWCGKYFKWSINIIYATITCWICHMDGPTMDTRWYETTLLCR